MSNTISNLKDIPTHLWLMLLLILLVIGWEIRPDETIKNLLLQVAGALLATLLPAKQKDP